MLINTYCAIISAWNVVRHVVCAPTYNTDSYDYVLWWLCARPRYLLRSVRKCGSLTHLCHMPERAQRNVGVGCLVSVCAALNDAVVLIISPHTYYIFLCARNVCGIWAERFLLHPSLASIHEQGHHSSNSAATVPKLRYLMVAHDVYPTCVCGTAVT